MTLYYTLYYIKIIKSLHHNFEVNVNRFYNILCRIDQLVHNHIEELRVRHLTRWNRYCSRILQNVLPRWIIHILVPIPPSWVSFLIHSSEFHPTLVILLLVLFFFWQYLPLLFVIASFITKSAHYWPIFIYLV